MRLSTIVLRSEKISPRKLHNFKKISAFERRTAYLRNAYIVMCFYVNCITRALIWILYLCVADQHGVTTPLLRVVSVREKLTLILNREVMNL